MVSTALILAGHGSHINPNTAGIVWQYVDTLRAWGVADEITACFWKEPPFFYQAIDAVTALDITIVPVFTARGYFSATVIPAEMGLDGGITHRDGRVIRYARTLGEHPYLAQIVQRRVIDQMQAARLKREHVAVALIGHGTWSNPQSRDMTRQQAAFLREASIAAEVVDVYLEDAPAIPEAYSLTRAPALIAVPFFLARGSHVSDDVPKVLGLDDGQLQGEIQGRQVYYTPPVGTDDAICELILQLARETGQPFACVPCGDAWSHFPAAGRDELIECVQQAGSAQFGELLLTPNEVRTMNSLESINDVFGSRGAACCAPTDEFSGEHLMDLTTPSQLRRYVRENAFRPLATARGLPGGWRVKTESPAMLYAVVETVYPGAVADWAAHRHGRLKVTSFGEVIGRQKGMFRTLNRLNHAQITHVTDAVCANCVRDPLWLYEQNESFLDANTTIPCREACNVWLSYAKEHIDHDR